MKVVIWKSYGEIGVYEAETPTQLWRIVVLIMTCLKNYGLEKECCNIMHAHENFPDSYPSARSAFFVLKDTLTQSRDDDNFEHLELTYTKECEA